MFEYGRQFGQRFFSGTITCWIKGFVLMLSLSSAFSWAAPPPQKSRGLYNLLVGTYTQRLYIYRFDSRTGEIVPVTLASAANPSYLVARRDGRRVYVANELPGEAGAAAGRGMVSAFRFEPETGRLTLLNQMPSGGNDPCYLSLSPDGRYLLVANYSVTPKPGGSFSVLPLRADGQIGPALLNISAATRFGPVRGRQDSAHVHSTVFSPDGAYLFALDLGADRLFAYRYDGTDAHEPVRAEKARDTVTRAGAGPRHLVFDANGRYAYATNELNSTVSVYGYRDGKLTLIEELALAMPGFKGKGAPAALHISPDGRFLYVSNRGDANEIVIYAIHGTNGRLTWVGQQSTFGKTPREFVMDPSGKWLIVANQDSDDLYVFKRDMHSGALLPTAKKLEIEKPADLVLIPVP